MSLLTIILTVLEVLVIGVLGLLALLGVGFLLLISVLSIYVTYTNRRDLKFLSAFACPKCDQVLGRAPILAAKERYEKKLEEQLKQRPRFVRPVAYRLADPIWEIECPECGFKFLFHPSESRIEIPSASAQPA